MRKHRSIKALQNEAIANNSIKAQYQLYSNYKHGDFVDQDDEEADKYLKMIDDNFRTTKIKLKNIRLINFRGFSDLSIDLSSDYVVIAANNGYGKTGVLESIYNCLTWIIRNFKVTGANGHFIKPDDIRAKEGVDAVSIVLNVSLMQGDVENSTYKINLSKTHSDADEKQDSDYKEFKYLADLYRDLGSLGYSIPVFAFYSVERGNAIKRNDFKKISDYSVLDFGSIDYALNTSNTPKFEAFLAWLLNETTKITINDAIDSDVKDLDANIKALELLNKLSSTDPSVNKLIDELTKTINRTKSTRRYNEKVEFTEKVNMVFSAISTFMPEVKDFSFEYDENSKAIELFCIKNDCKLSVSQLSQGEKTMLSLVCDIALRLISANQKSNNPFDGNGVIVIDEIDLHLHPIWQQSIIVRLNETFPNIQFVISTHSSNVLSTVSSECIRGIVASEGGGSGNYEVEIPYFSLGAENSTLQEEIQGVPSRPESLDIIKKLKKYKKMVANDEWDTPEAEQIFSELCKWAEGRDPIITKLRLDVSLRKKRRGNK
ncbi:MULTISPECIES: retron Ec78 anti-phage system effector ATPase PtuA [unclassified Serratia (in: enterobacteria)]|uniref:retron Ec78 anti-phage system effector ATPase PtuA n=1 Tax=unclassified Serratia (in: enterobacteria) TaxID=2647522 RepID=UPI0015F5CB68|nr:MULTISPECIES: retron Ec78 anti-phage system effector ATPase PtuA [unclassified Serratia (in: enterobacteria)]